MGVRLRGGSAERVANPLEWVATHVPAVSSQATVTRAPGGANIRHVCRSIGASAGAGATAPTATTVTLELVDGSTAIWSLRIGIEATAGRTTVVNLGDLWLPGSKNTAMILRFNEQSPGTNVFESVAMTGISIEEPS